jgi:hypothetical protein
MKTISALLLSCILIFCTHLSFSKGCGNLIVKFSSESQVSYFTNKSSIDTTFYNDDMINLNVEIYYSGCCVATINHLYQNGDSISAFSYSNFTIVDTGTYLSAFTRWNGCSDSYQTGTIEIKVHRGEALGLNQDISSNHDFQIFPSFSSGKFYMTNAPKNQNRILITDSLGKLVYVSSDNNGEIDLSNVSNGLYFYLVENKSSGKSFRGKLMKVSP